MFLLFCSLIFLAFSFNEVNINGIRNNMYNFLTKFYLSNPHDDDVFSIYSIYLAFSILYPGVQGNTKLQFENVFGFNETGDNYAECINYLLLSQEEKNCFSLENTLWIDKNYSIKDDYISTLHELNTFIHGVKFLTQPEVERNRINEYIKTVTNGLIEDLIPFGAVSSLTKLIVTNAIYFKDNWQEEFDLMEIGIDFKDIGEVKSMKVRNEMNLLQHNDYTSITIPYEHDFYMTIIMPSDIQTFEQSQHFQNIGHIIYSTLNTISNDVLLQIPLFKLDKSIELSKHLSQLGLNDVFNDNANFSGISNDQLVINGVFHKTFINVNEYSTEAAAATGITIGLTMAPTIPITEPIQVIINKPFYSVISRKNALPLFFTK